MSTRSFKLIIAALVCGLLISAVAADAAAPDNLAVAEGRDYFRSADFKSPMLSMELQYFRIPRDRWDLMLTRMAQYHADTISTYVHWGFHEPKEGEIDITGKTLPERDLVGFVKLCAKHNLKVVLKPGPFIDAETNAGGVPPWIWEKYPETQARSRKGKLFIHGDSGMPRLSYLHPKHLELTNKWFAALGRELAGLQYPNGPIVAIQVDNETPGDGFQLVENYVTMNFKADYSDYNVQTAWPEFLALRYESIGKLNAAYGSAYQDFSDVPMPREWSDPKDARAFEVYKDLNRFGEYQYVEGLRRFRQMLLDAGFYAPMYQDLLAMPWDMAGLIGDAGGMAEASGGWIGSNVYAEIYRLWSILSFGAGIGYNYNWDEYVHNGAWRVSLMGTLSEPYPNLIPEITCSRRFYFQMPIAFGADAVNIYVGWQTAKDNELLAPKGAWGMEACVTAEGGIRDCLWNGKNTFLFMEQSGAFSPKKKIPDLAIAYTHEPEHAWNWEYRFNLQYPHRGVRHSALRDAVLGTNTNERGQLIARQLVKQDIEFDVIHLDHLKPGQLERYKAVIIPTGDFGPFPARESMVVKEGGQVRVLLAPGDNDPRLKELEAAGVELRKAWTDSPIVDVTWRQMEGGPTVLGIVNRTKLPFGGDVHFVGGSGPVRAHLSGPAVGWVAIDNGGIRAAVIDDKYGYGRYTYGRDQIAFSGKYASIALRDGFVIATALEPGKVTVTSPRLKKPVKLVRVLMDGSQEEAKFEWREGGSDRVATLSFKYDPGTGDRRTDIYVALAEGVTLESAVGEHLARTARQEK